MTRGRFGLLLFASYWRCSSLVRVSCALGVRKLAGRVQEIVARERGAKGKARISHLRTPARKCEKRKRDWKDRDSKMLGFLVEFF